MFCFAHLVPTIKIAKCCLWTTLPSLFPGRTTDDKSGARPTSWSLWTVTSASFIKEDLERKATPILFRQMGDSRGFTFPGYTLGSEKSCPAF